ncbi:uncharacterized protein GGC65_002405 [Sphingopyxis sp. OAS728]|uniref:DUF418 domain-containing protein n=1 Tax=Sphingopyxis sp. OAS728 TaxID=2663823 RepID=UPI001789D0FE|nr:DUF418 domain-containing protein [Sphingopyxis sp. OAS728]MBE1527949.1 uncharacterized protein [Sphingopyxis sp. OAS728]
MFKNPHRQQAGIDQHAKAAGEATILTGASSTSAMQPVHHRMAHIDALRGLALLGVIVMNIGSMAMSINAPHVLAGASLAEMGVLAMDILLMFGKARASFAFLFGAGFAILLARASASHAQFGSFYTRRLLALLLFGIVNQLFLFYGDILVTYALLGFVLLLCRGGSDAALLKTGLVLAVVPPILHAGLELLAGGALPNLADGSIADRMARGLAAYSSPHYADAVRENFILGVTRHATATAPMVVGDLALLGLFFLGAWSVRTGLLTDPSRHAATLRRIAWVCIPAGFVLSAVNMLPMLGIRPGGIGDALITASALTAPVLAVGYLAGLTLLFSRTDGPLQRLLASAGRMALSNYLLSGAIGTWVLYGYGLGKLDAFGIAGLTLFGVSLFLALALASRLWLRAMPFGPAEWLWRRLSYRVRR